MVRIDGPGRTGAVGKTDKAKKTGSSSGVNFADLLTGEEEAAVENVSAPLATGSINALLSLQEDQTGDKDQRRQAVQYGDDLLDELDNLRLSLLTGNYTIVTLQNLAARISQRRVTVTDPHLLSLIDDVELRVKVELAKFGL